jgi:hypothetical protein
VTNLSAQQLVFRLRYGASLGLNLAAHRVQALTIPETPLEYGDLRDSLVVSESTPESLESSVSSDLPYAVAQHERLDYRHKVGGAKFLENNTLAAQSEVEQIMATTVKRVMEG